ncbi:hypothetical protein N1851_024134 [Merluccius polli]|uniref:Uncharacterized protein n=1 Tax=Merluccius polli TaxID=89951 RepID=A0AA47NX38_MERPO|nr:hypothetical protein N1851_024134 [Merluccius polli]
MWWTKDTVIGLFLWLFWGILWLSVRAQCEGTTTAARYTYSSGELYQLRPAAAECLSLDLPAEIRPRKRGRRGGARVKNRQRRFKPVPPSVLMGNVQSLVKKVAELAALCKYDRLFRQSSLLCFTETWLLDRIPSSHIVVEGFKEMRLDRDLNMTKNLVAEYAFT